MAERKPLFLSDEGFSSEMNVADTATFGGLALSGNIAMGGNLVTGLGAGVNNTDAVNKSQLDAAISGLDTKDSVRVATTGPLPANTAAGTGVGKTLTMNAVGILSVDGVNTVLGDRILVKDQVTGADNGIYEVTTEGTGGVAAVLTRATVWHARRPSRAGWRCRGGECGIALLVEQTQGRATVVVAEELRPLAAESVHEQQL